MWLHVSVHVHVRFLEFFWTQMKTGTKGHESEEVVTRITDVRCAVCLLSLCASLHGQL